MSDGPADQYDVVIVGGGPVGLGLAIELGQRGVRCAVLERFADLHRIPKGQNLTQRTMEHFHFWGAERALRAARTIPKEYGIGGLTAYRTLLSDYHYDWLRRELVRPFYFTDNERLPQYATEQVLRRRAADLGPVDILYGWTAEDVGQDGASASVTAVGQNGSKRRTFTGRYVVGCDGSHSVVRERVGIPQTRSDHDRFMVLLVFRSASLHDLLKRYPGKSFYSILHPDLGGYWKFFGRVDLGTTWFFHAPVPHGTTKDNFDFRYYLHEAVGAEFDVDFEHIGFWDLRIASADRYREGRIFIAGDAAHSHPPYGGYGINLGFEDARNLGWKLAAVLQGWGGEGLLESYDAERRPVFVSTARDFIESAIAADREFLADYDPEADRETFEREWSARSSGARAEVHAFEPNYAGSHVVFGRRGAECSAKGRHVFAARPGHHLAPQALSSGRNLFEALGEGFTLVALDAPSAQVERFEVAARWLGVPLNVIADSRDGGRDKYEASLILVRPDQYVAWTDVGGSADPSDIIARAAGV